MGELTANEVRDELLSWLGKGGVIDLSREPGARVTGWVMDPRFTDVSRIVRQSWLWDGFGEAGDLPQWAGLRNTFKERSTQIGLILTYSPAEYDNALGDSAQTA